VNADPHVGLFAAARACLVARDPDEKIALTERAAADWRAGRLRLDAESAPEPIGEPGRPERPPLVQPRDLPKRAAKGARGRAALIHAVAHIEFNAINLAWDAVYRFRGLPADYYGDWVRVAAEEAYHFGLMRGRLRAQGQDYGDFPAHDGLWTLARRTADDPLVRMALIPRVMEARGLDVTPAMIERLRAAGDEETAACLGIILRDEVGHVAAGSRWFAYLCGQRGLDPETTYFELLQTYLGSEMRCPLNRADRSRAGFGEEELDRLEALCGEKRAQSPEQTTKAPARPQKM
jgi:uncharacterized ferritin-like protein (DUF455 family)